MCVRDIRGSKSLRMQSPMYLPVVPIYITQEAWWPRQPTTEETEETVCTEVGSSADTEAPRSDEDSQLVFLYDHPATWQQYEDGLWLKCARLPLLNAC